MTPQLTAATLQQFQELLEQTTGIRLAPGDRGAFERQLRERLADLKLSEFEQYLALLRDGGSPDEMQGWIDAVVPGTSTPLHESEATWRHLHEWLRDRAGASLRAWCAACGDGTEALGLATLCDEYGVDATVLGTDVHSGRLTEARAREFQGSAQLEFAVHNLMRPLENRGTFDLVLLRHVLPEFDVTTQSRVLQHVHALVRPDGLLVLGEHESLLEVDHAFRLLRPSLFVRTVASERTRS